MRSASPKIASPWIRPNYGKGYFSDLAGHRLLHVNYVGRLVEQLGVLGGHRMSGPPSAAGT